MLMILMILKILIYDFEYVEDFDNVYDSNVLKMLMILMMFTILTILKMLMMALTLMKGYANRSN